MSREPQDIPSGQLSWSEVADAMWLAAVLGPRAPRPEEEPEPSPRPRTPESPPEPPRPVRDPEPRADPPSAAEAGPAAGPRPRSLAREPGREIGGGGSLPGTLWNALARKPSTMPGGPDILRALRPLKQLRPSSREDDLELDEDLTAEQAVQDGLWLPVLKPAPTTRVLDLTVIVDAGTSMALWEPEVTAFLKLVQQLGAFRTVRIRYLETEARATDGSLAPVLRGGTPDAPQHSVAELLDWYGDRLMFVLTDGAGEAWRRDLVSPLLAQWSRAMPVALVHLLPQHLWKKTGLPLHRAMLTTPGPFRPNGRYGFELPDAWMTMADPEKAVAGAVPVPVLELDGRWFGWWVRLVSRSVGEPVPGTVLLARDQPLVETSDDEPAAPRSAEERVRRFLGVATPSAFRLATLLAAVPVSLPIARYVREELVPEAGTSHLAEVFTSGLLGPPSAGGGTGNEAVFEVPVAIREALLAAGRRADTVRVVAVTGERFGERHPVLLRIADALADPDRAALPGETGEVSLERVVMRALSGPYARRAERLREREQELVAAQGEREAAKDENGSAPALVDKGVPDERLVADVREEAATSLRRIRRITTDAPVVWGAVPARNAEFAGRRELLDRLGASLRSTRCAVLHGPGGLGKTQIAVEYIYRQLRDHDLVWWVSAPEETQIRASLTVLARHLRLPGAEETLTAVPAVLAALRAGRPYRRWLLVFDAADQAELVRPFIPAGGPGRTIVTARDTPRDFPADSISVGRFARAESIELLRRRDPAVSDADADALARRLGDLPIALAQAAAWRAETGIPVGEYTRLLEEKVTEILDTLPRPSDDEISVAAAWNVSFDGLAARSPAAHQLLQVCAFFAAEPISRSLFAGVRGVSIAPELDTTMEDPVLLDRALRDINRCRLAKLDHRSGTLLLHRLAQLALRARMSDETRARMRHGAALLLANLDPNDPETAPLWPRYQMVLPHLRHAGLIDCDDPWVRRLLLNLMKFLYFSGDHAGSLALAEEAVAAWSDRYGAEDPQTLAASEHLGFVLWVLGRYEASSEVSRRTLRLYRRTVGPDSEQAMRAEITVAVGLKAGGSFFAARDLNRQTYEKVRSLVGDDDPIALRAAHDLVVSLLLAGDYEQARWLSEDTYERRSELLGYDNWETISSLNIMIICRRELGDYSWARIEQEKVVERVRGLFDSETDGVIRRDYHLAVAQRKDGYHEASLNLSGSALERFRLKYGSNHPNAMACALAHAMDLRNAGDFRESLALGEQALALYRGSLGDRHPHTLAAEVDIGVTLRLSGEPANALARDERALNGLRDRLGPAHPHVLACLINTANDWSALGDVPRSLRMNTETLARLRRALPDNHPTALAARLNRALDLERLGRIREAVSQHQEVLGAIGRVLRRGHPAIAAAEEAERAECDIDPMPL